MIEPTTYREFGTYLVSLHRQDSQRLVVVFASAGIDGPGEPIEEFKNSLTRFGASMLFVVDRSPNWYNHPETPEMQQYISEVASAFPNVAALGESMGGSGALNFARVYDQTDRILAFSPQYSVSLPFINFNTGLAPHGKPKHIHWSFAPAQAQLRAQILFGNTDWLDAVNAGMYLVERFNVHFIEGAGHLVGKFLKDAGLLLPLLDALTNFSVNFTHESVKETLKSVHTHVGIRPGYTFGDTAALSFAVAQAATAPIRMPPPTGLRDLALGGSTNQSSVSIWSAGKDAQEDSARAVNGQLTGTYAFHTDLDEEPWWSVDLLEPSQIHEVRIYNRLDSPQVAARSRRLAIDCASTSGEWNEVWRRAESSIFGGADGQPLVWRPSSPLSAQRVRIRLVEANFLHFDGVEVFGIPQSAAADFPKATKSPSPLVSTASNVSFFSRLRRLPPKGTA